jgi:hypothetical protein
MRHSQALTPLSYDFSITYLHKQKSKDMITQKELIQKRADFWKQYFLEQSQHDLNMTIGLLKSMTNSIYVNNGEKDGTGLYHSSILAETRLEEFASDHLANLINTVINQLVKDIDSLENLQT